VPLCELVRPLCETREGNRIVRRLYGRHRADLEAESDLTLISREDRLGEDMAALRAVAGSLQPCTMRLQSGDAAEITVGTGAPCPATALHS